jgi:hypothetical protein
MAASPAGATPVIVPKPQPVPLTPEEKVLLDRIDFELSGEYESRMESLAAAADLTESLIARDAIPEVRRRYLTDPESQCRRQEEVPYRRIRTERSARQGNLRAP